MKRFSISDTVIYKSVSREIQHVPVVRFHWYDYILKAVR